eukprot:TRINITY_DN8909_c0_g1_i1.p1 TRINITY_DN8909_c0_g1~~TRINITY_DN8909_c0_g1_i1.p1  ORF type:complete len:71 (-),score=16.83 TRINITY_DN8909_c0_g1_i1:244-456(-)
MEILNMYFESHQSKSMPNPMPQVTGKDVDLFLLYSHVTGRGGFKGVDSKGAWKDVSRALFGQEYENKEKK